MVRIFTKGNTQPIGGRRFFTTTDFDCHCERPECQKTCLDLDLVTGLEALSDLFGKIKITSGYRCPDHNKEVGGVADSQHIFGKAADCESEFAEPRVVARAAERIPVFASGGIGLYSRFTHLDCRGHKARWGNEINC